MRCLRGIAVIVLIFSATAGAYESECRKDATLFGGRLNENAYRESTCQGTAVPFCDEGLEYARGAMLGEHSWLVRQSARQAGVLSLFADEDIFDYYSISRQVPGSGQGDIPTFTTVEPVRPGVASVTIKGSCTAGDNGCRERKLTLAELAHLPDASHSMSDYLLGNEHCLVENLPSGDLANIQRCHTFAPHMGAVNSTHFLPQARAMYQLYHGLAKDVAERCAQKKQAMEGATNHTLAQDQTRRNAILKSCETEALAYEAIAQHYLADAWSAGHMWERWGSPLFPESKDEQINYITTALFAGLVHGWRAVARANIQAPGSDGEAVFFTHDQMCMAGPFDQEAWDENQDEAVVEWRNPGEPANFGGGDLYLFSCLAKEENADWAVGTINGQLETQRKRMLTCMTLGVADVYQAGPKTLGDVTIQSAALDELIGTTATDPGAIARCWDQRVTNQSMRLGLRVGKVPLDVEVLGGLVPYALPRVGAFAAEWGISEDDVARALEHASTRLRVDAVRVSNRARRLAKRSPDGTEMASLPQNVDTFLGLKRNSDAVSLIESDQVPYLEPHQVSAWTTYASPDVCNSDADCPPATYCAAGTSEAEPRCMHPEAAAVRAFPKGEVDTLCRQNSYADIVDAIGACTLAGSGVPCDACVDAVLPTIRNGCPDWNANDQRYTEYVYQPQVGDQDNRSLCDVVGTAPVYATYVPMDQTAPGDLEAMALRICTAGRDTDIIRDPAFEASFVRCGLGVLEESQSVSVQSLAPWNGDLYVTGDFYKAGGLFTKDIARWDGSRWHSVGGGNTSAGSVNYNGWVEVAKPAGDDSGLYVGGTFTEMGGVTTDGGIAFWDGSAWSAVGAGPGEAAGVHDIITTGTTVYAGGARSDGQGGTEGFVARWDGTQWADLGVFGCLQDPICSDPRVRALAFWNGNVVAGGNFTDASGTHVNHIALYNGTSWSRPAYNSQAFGLLELQLNGRVKTLDVDASNNLYVAGNFYLAGDCPFDCDCDGSNSMYACDQTFAGVARLNATDADGLFNFNGGIYEYTSSMRLLNGELYATVLDYPYFYRWNATNQTWDQFAGTVAGNGETVTTLAHDGTNLIAGGDFISIDGTTVNNVAAWNGVSWSGLSYVP